MSSNGIVVSYKPPTKLLGLISKKPDGVDGVAGVDGVDGVAGGFVPNGWKDR